MAAAQEDRGGAVLQAKEYLKSVLEGKSPAFRGPYTRQIAGLYDSIMNRTVLNENPSAADEAAYQWYLRLLGDAARDGTEVDAWPI